MGVYRFAEGAEFPKRVKFCRMKKKKEQKN